MAGRHTTHKLGFPCAVCCEQALKSVGERNTHGGCRCRDIRETSRAKEVALRGGLTAVALLYIEGGDLAAGGPPPAGELLTGNIGSLHELAATKSVASRSLRAYTSI
jgi:hypothetical protein